MSYIGNGSLHAYYYNSTKMSYEEISFQMSENANSNNNDSLILESSKDY